MISQEEAKALFVPVLKWEGKRWAKFAEVLARPAVAREKIVTITKDGKETENTGVGDGDMVIRNIGSEAQEEYIISASKFLKLYSDIEGEIPAELVDRGYKRYKAQGKVVRIEFQSADFEVDSPFYFTASWGEAMVVRDGDSIVMPPTADEVYRIEASSFLSTYAPEN